MSKIHIKADNDHAFTVTTTEHTPCGFIKVPNIAAIVGQGIKVCEELLDAEDKMPEEDLKR